MPSGCELVEEYGSKKIYGASLAATKCLVENLGPTHERWKKFII